MIVCDKKCRHQKDGYCSLEDITSLTGMLREPCGYFDPGQKQIINDTGSGQLRN